MTPSTTRQVADDLAADFANDLANDRRPTAQVLPLARAYGRRFRRGAAPDAAEPLGRILLFTGVRYERMPEAEQEAEPASPQRWHS